MTKGGECYICCMMTCFASLFIISIVVSSMLIHQGRKDYWIDTYFNKNNDLMRLSSIEDEWRDKMYADVITVDKHTACPADYNDHLIYDMWEGIPPACDCLLEDFAFEEYYYNEICDTNKRAHRGAGCRYGTQYIPGIQTIIKGFKFCGKKSLSYSEPYISPLKNVQPDIKTGTGYQCYEGYQPCNPETLESFDLLSKTICTQNLDDCPITDISFTAQANYTAALHYGVSPPNRTWHTEEEVLSFKLEAA